MHDTPATTRDAIQAAIDSHREQPGALLPILHTLQDRLGYIPETAIPMIATALHQTRAEIKGVISFYHHFHTQPPGRHRLQICRAEACQARGARELETHAIAQLGIDYHGTTEDRAITLEPVYCLGNCACGPSVRIDDRIVGRVDAARFDRQVERLRQQTGEEQA